MIVIKREISAGQVCGSRGYSSVVEHLTADQEVPGSTPGAPSQSPFSWDFGAFLHWKATWSDQLSFLSYEFFFTLQSELDSPGKMSETLRRLLCQGTVY